MTFIGVFMKKSKDFIFDGGRIEKAHSPDFYELEFFDHDLILFVDPSSEYKLSADELTIVGGRSATPFKSARLLDVLVLTKTERSFFIDSLSNGSKDFSFFVSDGRVCLVCNRLFHSTGLGIALLLDYSPECAARAIKDGLFDRLGDGIYSQALVETVKNPKRSENHLKFAYSVLKITDEINNMISETDVVSAVKTAANVIGCSVETYEGEGSLGDIDIDRDSFISVMLCQLSLCRHLSASRGGKLSALSNRGKLKISLDYEIEPTELSKIYKEGIDFCQRAATSREIPLSVDVLNNKLHFEFMPYRVDPSLYGLKAGIRIDLVFKE